MMAMDIDQAWECWQQKFSTSWNSAFQKDLCQKGNELPGSPNKLSVQYSYTCYHRAKQTGSTELLSKYKHLRNKVVHKSGKRDYLNNLKSASCKDFWKALKI